MTATVLGDGQIDLVHGPLALERQCDLLDRHVLVVCVLKHDLWPHRRAVWRGTAATEREGVPVTDVRWNEWLERDLRVPVEVKALRHLDQKAIVALVRSGLRLHDHLHGTLGPLLRVDAALGVALEGELKEHRGWRRRGRRRRRGRWRHEILVRDLEVVKVVRPLEAPEHQVRDYVVPTELDRHHQVDRVLVPERGELHVLAMDPRVVVVLVLEGDVRTRLRVSRRLGPERQRVHALVVRHEEGGERQEAVEVLLERGVHRRLEAVLALVRRVGAREVARHAAFRPVSSQPLLHDHLHPLRATFSVNPQEKVGWRRRRRRWRRRHFDLVQPNVVEEEGRDGLADEEGNLNLVALVLRIRGNGRHGNLLPLFGQNHLPATDPVVALIHVEEGYLWRDGRGAHDLRPEGHLVGGVLRARHEVWQRELGVKVVVKLAIDCDLHARRARVRRGLGRHSNLHVPLRRVPAADGVGRGQLIVLAGLEVDV
mmetsp:Transcript_21907/g.37391  ORF Transcript_21907/g.37391 Transcript_21907/m.37391 type:complete len:484 (+) Transcript_21907:2253-3704(+)